jgi:hypothetical protein
MVKRIFGVKAYGDANWVQHCVRQSLDPQGVFPATVHNDTLFVRVGTHSFDSGLDNKTFLYVTPVKKELKEYL